MAKAVNIYDYAQNTLWFSTYMGQCKSVHLFTAMWRICVYFFLQLILHILENKCKLEKITLILHSIDVCYTVKHYKLPLSSQI